MRNYLTIFAVIGILTTSSVSAQENKPSKDAAKTVTKADRIKAQKLVSKAYNICGTDAKTAEKHTLAALELYPKYLQARLFLGWLYNIKLGRLEESIKQYDFVIRNTPKDTVQHRKLKAQAFSEKGNVIYASTRNAVKALEHYNNAFRTFPTWQYAEVASNLYLHISDIEKAKERAEKAELLLTRLESKITNQLKTAKGNKKSMAEARLKQIPEQMLKVKVQIACCLAMAGKQEEAKAKLSGIKEFSVNVKYNLAILRCVQKDNDAAMDCLKEFMKTRSTAAARDQLRDFISEEPGLQGLKSHKDYAELVKRELKAEKK